MFSRRFWVLLSGTVLLLACILAGAIHMVRLERAELEHESAWATLDTLLERAGSTNISARVTEVELNQGEHGVFEFCTQDALEEARWKDAFEVVVWEPSLARLELKVPLDAPHLAVVKRSAKRSCLTLGSGQIERTGTYVIDLVWAGKSAPTGALRTVPVKARVLAKQPLSTREALMVFGAALGAMLVVLSGLVPTGRTQAAPDPGTQSGRRLKHSVLWAVVGSGAAALLAMLVLRIPIPGAIGGLVRGLTLSVVQVGIALFVAYRLYRTPRLGLALVAPHARAGAFLLLAVVIAALLRPMALFALRVVPATGEAPIEAFISWPSGALSFALLGMVLPLAEELFFRGFVYGALRPLGLALAIVLTTLLFAAVHAQQTWGNWGALLAVTLTGAALTCLRAASGSTLIPGVAHLLYNLSLWTDSFRS